MTEVYVIDTSVVMSYLINDTYSANAEVLFENVMPDDRLIVPEFCLAECTNVLWKQVKFHGLSRVDADDLLKELRLLPLQKAKIKRLLKPSLQIALNHNQAVYDAIFIAMARKFSCPLITVDGRQSRVATAIGVTLKPITDFK